ncbi:MAG TPA: hypothetical protein GX525_06370 [Bacilli bacterium]|nr:hypothetical protein [Bacilli bacterium]
MNVQDLLEAKQLLVGETKPNFYVMYEKFEDSTAEYVDDVLKVTEAGTEEVVQVLKGEQEHSLLSIGSYQIGEDYPSIEAVLQKVKEEHHDIFIS